MMAFKKCETGKKCMDCLYFPDINHLMMLVCLSHATGLDSI